MRRETISYATLVKRMKFVEKNEIFKAEEKITWRVMSPTSWLNKQRKETLIKRLPSLQRSLKERERNQDKEIKLKKGGETGGKKEPRNVLEEMITKRKETHATDGR